MLGTGSPGRLVPRFFTAQLPPISDYSATTERHIYGRMVRCCCTVSGAAGRVRGSRTLSCRPFSQRRKFIVAVEETDRLSCRPFSQ